MATTVVIAGVTYEDVPEVKIPRSGGGLRRFFDTNSCDVTTSMVMAGKVYCGRSGLDIGTGELYETSDANAVPSDVAYGKIFYNYDGRQVGTATEQRSVASSGSGQKSEVTSSQKSEVTSGQKSENVITDEKDSINAMCNGSDNVIVNMTDGGNHVCSGFKSWSINIPSTVTEIGFRAFFMQRKLRGVTAPGVDRIGIEAFKFSVLNGSVEFPAVTYVGDYAFAFISTLRSLKFPVLSSLPDMMIYGCDNCEDLWLGYNGVVSLFSSSWNTLSTMGSTLTVHVPAEQLAAYQADSDWQDTIVEAAKEGTIITIVGDYV